MILRFILALTVLVSTISTVSGLVHLRKHRHPMSSAIEEPTVVNAMHHQQQQSTQQQDGNHGNISSDRQAELHNFRHDDACGQATLSCMAFVHDQIGMPVRCGMLKNAPVCLDAEHECTAFCDEDGGSRVCQYAFPECCSHSPNGCITSEPRHTKFFPLKKGQ